jgi:intracellular sulfur oxidation DsrE/DsrF family protein
MKTTIVINSEFLGRGDDELGAKLMTSFLSTLLAAEFKPDRLVFYNSAVKLLSEGHVSRETLDALHLAGVRLTACGTCVGWFKLEAKIPREFVSNMREIVDILNAAERVVTV